VSIRFKRSEVKICYGEEENRQGTNVFAEVVLCACPGLGQDRVNFHQKPGADTARWADPIWPNRAGYSIPCAVMLGSGWGELGGGKAVVAREHVGHWVVRVALCILLFVLCILLTGIDVVIAPFVCCSVKLPLSRPTCFCLFLSILFPTPAGGEAAEQPCGPFVAGHSQTITLNLAPKHGAGITAGLSRMC